MSEFHGDEDWIDEEDRELREQRYDEQGDE